ncbi:unnamed protein product [Acanthoscelides obtectus]|uniref:Uncharacterized protein n=1 Tax=Acanthoscelides obtectus TaxID=200917 RepID=A0A9P0PNC3_ACAOB|nr:unnamed protein product [Acanthoscelides obtectus]CAK1620885.1 hypothetical protein AOBTE_LOCUS633 [Acanthoscelides obtectus]
MSASKFVYNTISSLRSTSTNNIKFDKPFQKSVQHRNMSLKITFILIFAMVAVRSEIPEISINSSSVPNITYEFEAQKDLKAAYELHPNDLQTVVRIFSDLYNKTFPQPTGWKVSIGCSLLYQPAVNHIYVALNVVGDNSTTVITIFN